MTVQGNAVKAMFNAIVDDTILRARKWFKEHPDEPYCYWAKDDFISIADKTNKAILEKHPEIEDINDHTIVQYDFNTDIVQLSRFCPKLKAGIKAMVDGGYTANTVNGCHWYVKPDSDNFKVVCYGKN